mmetsp:Transcript_8016/g.12724  ORF Transcript_8016/g.12724 Transcript_8016/m.12724 type:complete len:307 (+) Transcript_8016:791-1711(+)
MKSEENRSRSDSKRAVGLLLEQKRRKHPKNDDRIQRRYEELLKSPVSGRYQDDPEAMLKLKDKAGLGGGWKEPKGGFKRWFEAQQDPDEIYERAIVETANQRDSEQASAGEPASTTLDEDMAELQRYQSASVGKELQTVTDSEGKVWNVAPAEGLDLNHYDKWRRAGLDKASAKQQVAAYKVPGKDTGAFYPDGIVLHKNWRAESGYKPVDTSGVDAMRPRHQQMMIKMMESNIKKRKADKEKQKMRRKESKVRDWHPDEKASRTAPEVEGKFSYTDFLGYQAAIRNHIKRKKWKRKLAEGKPPPL